MKTLYPFEQMVVRLKKQTVRLTLRPFTIREGFALSAGHANPIVLATGLKEEDLKLVDAVDMERIREKIEVLNKPEEKTADRDAFRKDTGEAMSFEEIFGMLWSVKPLNELLDLTPAQLMMMAKHFMANRQIDRTRISQADVSTIRTAVWGDKQAVDGFMASLEKVVREVRRGLRSEDAPVARETPAPKKSGVFDRVIVPGGMPNGYS